MATSTKAKVVEACLAEEYDQTSSVLAGNNSLAIGFANKIASSNHLLTSSFLVPVAVLEVEVAEMVATQTAAKEIISVVVSPVTASKVVKKDTAKERDVSAVGMAFS